MLSAASVDELMLELLNQPITGIAFCSARAAAASAAAADAAARNARRLTR
jgi:hypothetical protein